MAVNIEFTFRAKIYEGERAAGGTVGSLFVDEVSNRSESEGHRVRILGSVHFSAQASQNNCVSGPTRELSPGKWRRMTYRQCWNQNRWKRKRKSLVSDHHV